MRVVGFVTVNGVRARIDWTITADGITEGPGLSAAEVLCELPLPEVQAAASIEYTDGYGNLTVTDLRTRLSQRGEPVYGNKEQLIARLRGWDANNPDGYQEAEVVEETEEVVSDDDFVDHSDDAYDDGNGEVADIEDEPDVEIE